MSSTSDGPGSIAFRARLLALGAGLDGALNAATRQLFAPHHVRAPFADIQLTRDEIYGPHRRHRLDIFAPRQPDLPRPIVLFVHGGGFVGGDKHVPDTPFHDNVGVWAARAGYLGVNMTYRLAPDVTWPAGASDIAAAITHLRLVAASFGGDPARIALLGTSAGGTHVATYLCGAAGPVDESVRAAALLSGIYDLSGDGLSPNVQAYFGADTAQYRDRLSVEAIAAVTTPLMVTVSENDPPRFGRQWLDLVEAYMRHHEKWPHAVRVMGHNHFSSTLQLNTSDQVLSRELEWFFAQHLA